MASTDDLAADLGLDEGDVVVLLRQLGEETPEMPDELAAWIRRTFDPHGGALRASQPLLAGCRR